VDEASPVFVPVVVSVEPLVVVDGLVEEVVPLEPAGVPVLDPSVPAGVTVPAGVSPAVAGAVELVVPPDVVTVGTMLSPPEIGIEPDAWEVPFRPVVLPCFAAGGFVAGDGAGAGV